MGRYTWSNGSTYEGGVAHGLRDGQGVFTSADGTLVRQEDASQSLVFCWIMAMMLRGGWGGSTQAVWQSRELSSVHIHGGFS